jgi:hypothetical protein
MKIDWPLIFYVFTILFSVAALVNNDLQALAVGLLFSVLGMITERRMK